jgi:hypothetical protein
MTFWRSAYPAAAVSRACRLAASNAELIRDDLRRNVPATSRTGRPRRPADQAPDRLLSEH